MFLSGSLLGISVFEQAQSKPVARQYSKIKVYGNATIDKLHVRSTALDNTTLQNIILTDQSQWTPDTLLLARFENNLGGGNIVSLTESITNWQVNRTDTSSNVLKVLGTVDVSQTSYVDYTAQANKTYQYEVFGLSTNQISEGLLSSQILTNFYGHYIIGQDSNGTTYAYKLDLNASLGSVTNNEDFTEYPSYTKYNSYAKGQRNYLSGTISAIAGDIQSNTGEILQTPDYIDTLRNRIQDISTKYLKTRKGEVYLVKTHNFSMQVLDNGIGSQPYIVQFDFAQCADL